MLGYTNKHALGSDIFSLKKGSNIVVFPSGNWLTNTMYYDSSNESARPLTTNIEISVEEIEENNKIAEEMLTVSNNIIVYDLIRKTSEQNELLRQYGG